MIERKEEIVTANSEKANRAEALVERIGERVAYPGEVGLTGPVVEGQDEDETPTGRSRIRAGAILGGDVLLDTPKMQEKRSSTQSNGLEGLESFRRTKRDKRGLGTAISIEA